VRRDGAALRVPQVAGTIAWFTPVVAADEARLSRWRESVGPPVVQARDPSAPAADAVTIVSWNTALGAGDIPRFVRTLTRSAPLVLLLQEVYRGGPAVPSALPRTASFAGRLGGAAGWPSDREIQNVAEALDLTLYYVPSMRNGAPSSSDEDRGNAILTNLPLTELAAIELPFERQRRVAIAATATGRTTTGARWQVRFVNAHLDNLAGPKRAWIAAEYARTRQARGLTGILGGDAPTVLAGDFNTWFGYADRAYVETALAFPETRVSDTRATFHGLLRLDHVFFRLPPGWHGEFHRADERFGSDHYPLVGKLSFRSWIER
jgi:endonuclease/exonuclease/phosphatase family metal-dependent hydrolase